MAHLGTWLARLERGKHAVGTGDLNFWGHVGVRAGQRGGFDTVGR